MKCKLVIKRSKPPTHITAWMNFKSIMLGEIRQTQKTTYSVILFM